MTGFLFKTSFGRSFNHILEMPLFVSSSVTPAIQLADILAGITRHYYERNLDTIPAVTPFENWIVEIFQRIYAKTEDNKSLDGKYTEYGFQKIGKNFSYPVDEKFL